MSIPKHALNEEVLKRELNDPPKPQTTRYAPNSFESQLRRKEEIQRESAQASAELVRLKLKARDEAEWAAKNGVSVPPLESFPPPPADTKPKLVPTDAEVSSEVGALLQHYRNLQNMLGNITCGQYVQAQMIGDRSLHIGLDWPQPFDWYWSDTKIIKVKAGPAVVHGTGLQDGLSFAVRAENSLASITLPDATAPTTHYVEARVSITWPNTDNAPAAPLVTIQGVASYSTDARTGDVFVFYFPLYEFYTPGAAIGANARYVMSRDMRSGTLHVWPSFPLWTFNSSSTGLQPTVGTHLDATWDKAVDNTITFEGGLAKSKT